MLDQKTGPGNLLPGERDQRMTGPGIYGTENVYDHLQSVDLQPIKVEETNTLKLILLISRNHNDRADPALIPST